jgi:protein-S-isoprenylcysteine O-methyltransferase Ste14
MTLVRTLVFTVLVPGTVAVYVPQLLVSSSASRGTLPLGWFRYAGLIGMVIGAGIYLWCAWDFTFAGKGTPAPIDPPKELVVRGPYKYVRNPMYVGVLSAVIGQAVWFESRVLFLYALICFLLFCCFVVFFEEPALRTKFGDSYQDYCKRVPRWIPRITP